MTLVQLKDLNLSLLSKCLLHTSVCNWTRGVSKLCLCCLSTKFDKKSFLLSFWTFGTSEQQRHCFLIPGELLSSGERREVEIRGCSIWCVEKIKNHLWKLVRERDGKSCAINSALIDFYLWPYAKQHHEEMAHIPIHHTRCVYYWNVYRMLSFICLKAFICLNKTEVNERTSVSCLCVCVFRNALLLTK